jgi:hypothetical protein
VFDIISDIPISLILVLDTGLIIGRDPGTHPFLLKLLSSIAALIVSIILGVSPRQGQNQLLPVLDSGDLGSFLGTSRPN